MVIMDSFRNFLFSVVGVNQEFEQLLKNKDISAVKERMQSNVDNIVEAMSEYNTRTHDINKRPDKIITDKKGNFLRKEEVWKLPIPYQAYINEIALVFLYGRPIKWTQASEQTEKAFEKFRDVIKATRFNSKVRQCKRIAGAETQSAMLFRVFRNTEGKADVQIRVLAYSKGDEIYIRRDQYENITAFAWGYNVREENNTIAYHFDVFTPKTIYRCKQKNVGWEVVEEPNLIGKIPVILFEQDKEWKGVEPLIAREEHIASKTADTNDYFSDPIAIMNAEIIKNMPDKKDSGKMLVTNDKDGVDKAAKYLTWDSAPESKRQEIEWLQDQILNKTFTPKITLDSLKSLSQLSAKALRTVMMLAVIKANKHKETHDELMDRTASLLIAIIGNVLDVSLANECKRLIVEHEFQEPFGDDVSDALANIIKSYEAGILSQEGAIEMSPIVKDAKLELARLKSEQEEQNKASNMLFSEIEGAKSAFADAESEDNNNND